MHRKEIIKYNQGARDMKANDYIREVETVFKPTTGATDYYQIKSSQDAYRLFSDLQNDTREKLIALHLSHSMQVTCFQVVHIGTATQSLVHPQDIIRTALLTGATSLIIVHNHPSGNITPSPQDKDILHKLIEACELLSIQIVDFIIIGGSSYYSALDSGDISNLINERKEGGTKE